jgi:uncharacterized protein (DUF952 family)
MTHILHITRRDDWEVARREGAYRPPSLKAEGFIHFSQLHQVLLVADTFYAGQSGLVLLEVDTELLSPSLRWEPPDGRTLPSDPEETSAQGLFPHLYGPLNPDAVVAVHDFPLDADNRFALPLELTTGVESSDIETAH